MIEICEWCPVSGERVKRLPFGEQKGKAIIILDSSAIYDAQDLLQTFPDTFFVWRKACQNASSYDGNLGCGVLIRSILANYKIVVLPKNEVKAFFGIEVEGSIVQFKTGQYIIPYTKLPTEMGTIREFERVSKQ